MSNQNTGKDRNRDEWGIKRVFSFSVRGSGGLNSTVLVGACAGGAGEACREAGGYNHRGGQEV